MFRAGVKSDPGKGRPMSEVDAIVVFVDRSGSLMNDVGVGREGWYGRSFF